MTAMIVDRISRTGHAASAIRQIKVYQGKHVRVLTTPIEKLTWAPEFRFGQDAKPIEQYVFRVGNKTVERFADATALVLKRHNVQFDEITPRSDLQIYVQKALAIMDGTEQLHVHNDLPTDAKPAIVTLEALV